MDSARAPSPSPAPAARAAPWRLAALGVAWLAGLAAFAAANAFAWEMFLFPAELEWREGSNWLHAIALADAHNIFKFSARVYVNANHGIGDHLFKGALLSVFPSLPAAQVTRIFVPLLPPLLVLLAWPVARAGVTARPFRFRPSLSPLDSGLSTLDRLLTALLLGSAAYLALQAAGFWLLAVGRSDATACVLLAAAALFLRHTPVEDQRWYRQLAFAGLVALTFFTNWRYLPLCAALPLIGGARLAPPAWSRVVRTLAILAGVGAGLYAAFVLAWFGGSPAAFNRYFFGMFLGVDGLAAEAATPLATILAEGGHLPEVILLAAMPVAILAHAAFSRFALPAAKRAALVAATACAGAAAVTGLMLVRNYGSGGFHYLSPLAVLFVLYASVHVRPSVTVALVLLVAVAATIGVSPRLGFMRDFVTAVHLQRENAAKYVSLLGAIDREIRIVSDDAHFFRRRGRLPTIDMGDIAQAFAGSGKLGPELTATFSAYTRELETRPPPAILVGATSSPALKSLAESGRYLPAFPAPPPLSNATLYIRGDRMQQLGAIMERMNAARPGREIPR